MATIQHTVKIDAAPERVYRALTEQKSLSAWWADCTTSAVVGGEALFRFDGGRGRALMRIEKLVSSALVEWRCLDHQYGEERDWIGTTIRFELRPDGHGGTTLDFTQDGWKDQLGCYDRCVEGWGHFVKKSLKGFIEAGSAQADTAALGKEMETRHPAKAR